MSLEPKHQFNDQLLNLKIPGKTFLCGEYAVLSEKTDQSIEALCLGTRPEFKINQPQNIKNTFHPESPAGLLLKKYQLQLCFEKIENPYLLGGFGASTAEFIFSYYFSHFSFPEKAPLDLDYIFQTYLDLFEKGLDQQKKRKPSGADLVTQLLGGVVHFKKLNQKLLPQVLTWDMPGLDFLIYSTGFKVKTHEHLENLDRKVCDQLVQPSFDVIQSFKTKQAHIFKQELVLWSKKLQHLNLMASPAADLKEFLQSQLPDTVVKPCGALGADVILILAPCDQVIMIKTKIEELKMQHSKLVNFSFKADSLALSLGPMASIMI